MKRLILWTLSISLIAILFSACDMMDWPSGPKNPNPNDTIIVNPNPGDTVIVNPNPNDTIIVNPNPGDTVIVNPNPSDTIKVDTLYRK